MKHKLKILELRKEGKSYKEIQKELKCSISTISYHCSTNETKLKCVKKEKSSIKNKRRLPFEEYIEKWKKGEVSGGRGDLKGHGYVSHHVRKYLFEKYSNKCARCGWSELNTFTQTIPLEVEHIDGNSLNHKEENLILLCPNCHSLTRGHSSSKGNGRRYYREKYRKEVGAERLELS